LYETAQVTAFYGRTSRCGSPAARSVGLRHTFAPGTSTRLPSPHATGYLIFDKNTRVDTTSENMSWADSAGALISTASDLSRFWSAIGNGTLLPPAQIREMRQTVPAAGGDVAAVPGSRYGLGIFSIPLTCGGVYWSHEGDVPGYNTIAADVHSRGGGAPRSLTPRRVTRCRYSSRLRGLSSVRGRVGTGPRIGS
jgi:beta-lactamase family protein